MHRRALGGCGSLALFMAVAGTAGAAGQRDLTGLWSNASTTSLQRPAGVTALEVSPEEARRMNEAHETIGLTPAEQAKTRSDPNAPPPPVGDKDFGVKA